MNEKWVDVEKLLEIAPLPRCETECQQQYVCQNPLIDAIFKNYNRLLFFTITFVRFVGVEIRK